MRICPSSLYALVQISHLYCPDGSDFSQVLRPLSLVDFDDEALLSVPVAESNGVIFSLAKTLRAIGFSIATLVDLGWEILPKDLGSSGGIIVLLDLMLVQTLDTTSSFLSCVSRSNSGCELAILVIVCSTCSGRISSQSTVDGNVSRIISSMPFFSSC